MSGHMSGRMTVPPGDARPDLRAEGIALLLWACEPKSPHRLATPFFHAAAAAALLGAGGG